MNNMSNPFIIESNPKKIKNRHIDRFGGSSSNEFLNYSAGGDSLKNTISANRIAAFFFIIFIALLAILSRIFFLQIIQGNKWFEIAEGNRIRIEKTIAPRGVIFDSKDNLLVDNEPNFVLSFIPGNLVKKDDETSDFLNYLSKEIPEVNLEDIKNIIKSADSNSFEEQEILSQIPYDRALEIMVKIKDNNFLRVSYLSQRIYLDENYGLSGILGYLGKINKDEWQSFKDQGYLLIERIGKSGLEKTYEKELRGTPGEKKIEVDAIGNVKRIISDVAPKNGVNLKLSIDSELNKYLAEKLCSIAASYGGKAAGIAIDPNNGGILASVSCPLFDNNIFSDTKTNTEKINSVLNNPKQPLFNRVYQGEYPAGSVFKLVIGSAGLQEKIINETTSFLSNGGLRIGEWFFPDWKAGGHGQTNLKKAIAESVNTFFYYVGGGFGNFQGLGVDKIIEYAKKFNLGKKTGIDLPEESDGFLPSRDWKFQTKNEEWYIGDTYHLAIGQGDLLVTPAQIALITSFFANNGTIYQPHILQEFLSQKGEGESLQPKILVKNIINKDYISQIRNGMRSAVIDGSARILLSLPVSSAAKTGTAQVGGDKNPHAWFTAFAPFENPEIVLTILIENGVEGSSGPAQVARDVLVWYFSNKM
jgi:penicillin-binding protein 2